MPKAIRRLLDQLRSATEFRYFPSGARMTPADRDWLEKLINDVEESYKDA